MYSRAVAAFITVTALLLGTEKIQNCMKNKV